MRAGIFIGFVLLVVLGFAGAATFVSGGGLDGLGSPHESQNGELQVFATPPGWGPVYWLGSSADTAPPPTAAAPWILHYDTVNSQAQSISQPLHVKGTIVWVTVVSEAYPSATGPAEWTSDYQPLTGVIHRKVSVRLYVRDDAPYWMTKAIRAQALHDLQPIATS